MIKYKNIIYSIISGLLMGYIFIYFYNKQCEVYHGPDSNIVRKKIFIGKDNKYYRLIPKVCFCPI